MIRPLLALGCLALFTPTALIGQQAPPPRCETAAHRAFDYWIGEWAVTDTTGRPTAESSITRVSGGCAIAEHWRPLGGTEGRSLSWFEPKDGKWHQQWIGGTGWLARFTGEVVDGALTLTEVAHPADTMPRLARMAWVRLGADTVRQLMWSSQDAGTTWTLLFVGQYVRKRN